MPRPLLQPIALDPDKLVPAVMLASDGETWRIGIDATGTRVHVHRGPSLRGPWTHVGELDRKAALVAGSALPGWVYVRALMLVEGREAA